jgi:predicted N-acetyltransferase YhbS
MHIELARIEAGSDEHTQMIDLRDRVLRKPLGRSLSAEDTKRDANADLLVARREGRVVACCLLTRETSSLVQLRAMAVAPELQRQGIGRALVAFAEAFAREGGAEEIQLEGRVAAHSFYAGLGYVVEGDEYLKVGIPHRLARKRLLKE